MLEGLLPGIVGALGMLCIGAIVMGAKKYVPVLKAKLSAWWSKGKTDLAMLKADVADAHSGLAAIESKFAGFEAEFDQWKAKVAAMSTPAAPLPAPAPQPAPAAAPPASNV
jgi:hypothetical protein